MKKPPPRTPPPSPQQGVHGRARPSPPRHVLPSAIVTHLSSFRPNLPPEQAGLSLLPDDVADDDDDEDELDETPKPRRGSVDEALRALLSGKPNLAEENDPCSLSPKPRRGSVTDALTKFDSSAAADSAAAAARSSPRTRRGSVEERMQMFQAAQASETATEKLSSAQRKPGRRRKDPRIRKDPVVAPFEASQLPDFAENPVLPAPLPQRPDRKQQVCQEGRHFAAYTQNIHKRQVHFQSLD